ncbi:ABC transporter permease [Flavobacteriales bacterium]|nr:ABC transporter permease [Crocinitomicaceae bacterium]MBT5403096.1 ABC transporter permease [Crocinitomicaceae bacterium]MBT6514098.1 ABC transporter permease [Crocinitomicaceae bacterium]MDC3337852.1 ABC transporter permease [Flavobacteriales bacterium]MDG2331414.1 ABC transporter permease [Flavobacteriales bacterium]
MTFIQRIGEYSLMLGGAFSRPDKLKVFWKRCVDEVMNLGVNSMGIVFIISIFMGMVITIQTASNIDSELIPKYTVGFTARQTIVLEFSPTIISLILAGIVGSRISSELGSMRVTEQIDALEIMGVNSKNYLVLPKILGFMFILPFIIIYSMVLGLFGGWVVGMASGIISSADYIYGLQYWFEPFSIFYALIKTVLFAFIIASVSSYYGYYVKGGSLEVGKASTKAVIWSSIAILFVNYLVTQLLLID